MAQLAQSRPLCACSRLGAACLRAPARCARGWEGMEPGVSGTFLGASLAPPPRCSPNDITAVIYHSCAPCCCPCPCLAPGADRAQMDGDTQQDGQSEGTEGREQNKPAGDAVRSIPCCLEQGPRAFIDSVSVGAAQRSDACRAGLFAVRLSPRPWVAACACVSVDTQGKGEGKHCTHTTDV
jgi:hypothetical protein